MPGAIGNSSADCYLHVISRQNAVLLAEKRSCIFTYLCKVLIYIVSIQIYIIFGHYQASFDKSECTHKNMALIVIKMAGLRALRMCSACSNFAWNF